MNLFATFFSTAKGIVGQTASGWSRPHENGATSALLDASKGPVGSVFEALDTAPEGLTEPEVQERLETYGRNTVARACDGVAPHAAQQLQKPVHPRVVRAGIGVVLVTSRERRSSL